MAITYPWDAMANAWVNADLQEDDHPAIHNSVANIANAQRVRPARAHEVTAGSLAVTIDHGIACYSGTGGHTFTMPAASTLTRSRSIIISNVGTGSLTIAPTGGDTFGLAGLSSVTLPAGCCVELASDGAAVWYPIGAKDFIDHRWTDLRVAPALRGTGATVPPLVNYNASGIYAYQFSAGDEMFATIQMPHGWDKGEVRPHVHWKTAGAIAAGSLTWTLEYIRSNPASGSTDQTKVTDTATFNTTANAFTAQIADFTPVTWAGATISELAIIRVALTANTTGQDPFLWEFDLHWRQTRPGTINPASEP